MLLNSYTTYFIAGLLTVAGSTAHAQSYSRYKTLDCQGGKVRIEMTRGELAYSPDPAGGAPYVSVYGGRQRVTDIIACPLGGVITRFNGGGIYYSPTCYNLGGGGATKRVYSGKQSLKDWNYHTMNGKQGILSEFSSGGLYFSPDCLNVGGGGATKRLN